MKLTIKKLVWATIISLILTVIKLTLDNRFGNWFSPLDVRFWANDIAVILAWGIYFLQKRKT